MTRVDSKNAHQVDQQLSESKPASGSQHRQFLVMFLHLFWSQLGSAFCCFLLESHIFGFVWESTSVSFCCFFCWSRHRNLFCSFFGVNPGQLLFFFVGAHTGVCCACFGKCNRIYFLLESTPVFVLCFCWSIPGSAC